MPVGDYLRPGPPPLRVDQSVGEALEAIRSTGLEERIFYFYVVDSEGRLSGVVPARKLLTEALDSLIGDVMMKRVLSLPESATLMEACECFIMHKFLAIPVVDSEKRLRGIRHSSREWCWRFSGLSFWGWAKQSPHSHWPLRCSHSLPPACAGNGFVQNYVVRR